ncbi:MAG: SRPBCC family protein [Acidobacteria bacterium]|nr:SRPBCC family protein [Acidobacteriota bacterium]
MEKLLNEFTVNRSIDHAWAVLTDVERIAPCLPGAQLQEIEGDVFRGVVKVKLGPISTAFKGQATFVERDDTNHRAVLKGEGRDTGGKGNADALITAQLESVTESSTKVVVTTELHITGKVAQFGRGIMGDVSEKLMAQFANNLNTMLDAEGEAPAAAPQAGEAPATTAEAAVAEPPAASEATTATATSEAPTVRRIEGPAAEPIELSDLAGSAVVKRLLPVFGGLVVLLLLLRRLRK